MVGEWVAKLAEQEMLIVRPESRFPGERELVFRHALLREGAYAMLTEEDRRLGHRLAGEWLEQHGEGDPMALAGHFERGGDGARAASFYLRAAEQAFTSSTWTPPWPAPASASPATPTRRAPDRPARLPLRGHRPEHRSGSSPGSPTPRS